MAVDGVARQRSPVRDVHHRPRELNYEWLSWRADREHEQDAVLHDVHVACEVLHHQHGLRAVPGDGEQLKQPGASSFGNWWHGAVPRLLERGEQEAQPGLGEPAPAVHEAIN